MGPKKKRASAWPLILVSALLLLAPSSVTQKTRLTAIAGFIPFRSLATWAEHLPDKVRPSAESQEAATKVAFLEDQNLKQANELKRLSLQLEQALGMKQPVRDQSYRMITADVIFPTDSSPWRKSLTIASGTNHGVEKGMLVVYNSQVVGRVSETGPKTSRIQTVTDPGFRAAAVAAPRSYVAGVSLTERHPGVYTGTSGENGELKCYNGETAAEPGAFGVTAEDPVNGVPRGLILGRVTGTSSARNPLPRVGVEPVLNFRGLEHVMLLVPPMEVRTSGLPSKPGGGGGR
jgi:rod shape-determining protein MreC